MTELKEEGVRPAMAAAVDGDLPSSVAPEDRGGVWDKPALGWVIFEFARNPYYLLVIIYIFAPYLAGIVAADAVARGEFAGLDASQIGEAASAYGQAFVAGVTKWAGFAAAITAPILGATLDRGGRRKPIMMVFLGLLAVMSFSLWWTMPGEAGLPYWAVGLALIVAAVSYTYSEVTHNAMLKDAARPELLPNVSGNGLALGNLGGTIAMLLIVFLIAMPGEFGWPLSAPIFGFDVSEQHQFRIAGPLAAIWLVVFVGPFFLWSPDAGIKGASWSKAAKEGLAGLFQTLKRASHYKETMKFLIARMIYADGMAALLALGAVYVAGALNWNFQELVGYAIWLSIFGTFGGFLGGMMDRTLGVKNSLLIELIALVIVLVGLISITEESIFFGLVESRQLVDWPVYSHLHDWAYLGVAGFLAVVATACISSSRSMLVALAPKKMIGEFFGLYAIAGTITVWLGPLLVETFTRMFNSQRIGMATISVLFLFGIVVMLTVKYQKGQQND